MALDRPDEGDADGPGEARPEAPRHHGSDASAPRTEVAETRSHAEYYEALRAADGGHEPVADGGREQANGGREQANGRTEQANGRTEQADGKAEQPDGTAGRTDGRIEQSDGKAGRTDGRTEQADGMAEQVEGQAARVDGSDRDAGMPTGRSGWDAVDPGNRPRLDALRATPERTKHILDGDEDGGGHRHGVGKPEKTEFPASWSDEKTMGHVLDAAQRPDSPPVHQNWNDRWLCSGTRDRVKVWVVVLPSGEVWTAWPEEGGPGVVRNPRKETS
jgi:hypothetical protein